MPPSPLQGGTVQGQERPQLVISPTGVSDSMWGSPWPPQLCRMLPKRPTSFSPSSDYSVLSHRTQGQGAAGREADRTLGRTSKGLRSYCTEDPIKKSTHQLLGTSCPWIPTPAGPQYPQRSARLTHTHSHLGLAPCVPPDGGKSEL